MNEPKKGWGERFLDGLAGCFGQFLDYGMLGFIFYNFAAMKGDTFHLGAMIFGMYVRWRWHVTIGKK